MSITNAELTQMKARADAVGEFAAWEAVDSDDVNMASVVTKGLGGYTVGIEMAIEDAQFIAHAREDVPRLVAEVERLQAEVNRLDELYSQKYMLATHYKNATYEYSLENERLRKALTEIRDGDRITANVAYEIAEEALK